MAKAPSILLADALALVGQAQSMLGTVGDFNVVYHPAVLLREYQNPNLRSLPSRGGEVHPTDEEREEMMVREYSDPYWTIEPTKRSEVRTLTPEDKAAVQVLANALSQRAEYNATTGTWTPVSEADLIKNGKFDLVLVLGSSDARVPVEAAAIVKKLRSVNPDLPVITSGMWGANVETAGVYTDETGQRIPEATYYKNVMEKLGVSVQWSEAKSENTGQNIRNSAKILQANGLSPWNILIIQTPWLQARSGAVAAIEYPKALGVDAKGVRLVSYAPYIPVVSDLSDEAALEKAGLALSEVKKLADWPAHKPDAWSVPVPMGDQVISDFLALSQIRSEVRNGFFDTEKWEAAELVKMSAHRLLDELKPKLQAEIEKQPGSAAKVDRFYGQIRDSIANRPQDGIKAAQGLSKLFPASVGFNPYPIQVDIENLIGSLETLDRILTAEGPYVSSARTPGVKRSEVREVEDFTRDSSHLRNHKMELYFGKLDRAADVWTSYQAAPDAVKETMLEDAQALLYSGYNGARSGARWLLGKVLGHEIQDMLEWQNNPAAVAGIYREYYEKEQLRERKILLGILFSASQEDTKEVLQANAVQALDRIDDFDIIFENGEPSAAEKKKEAQKKLFEEVSPYLQGLQVVIPGTAAPIDVVEAFKRLNVEVLDHVYRIRESADAVVNFRTNTVIILHPGFEKMKPYEKAAFLAEKAIQYAVRDWAGRNRDIRWSDKLEYKVLELAKIKTAPIRLNMHEQLKAFYDKGLSVGQINARDFELKGKTIKPGHFEWMEDVPEEFKWKAAEDAVNGLKAEFIFAAGKADRLFKSFLKIGIIPKGKKDDPVTVRKFRMWNLDVWEVIRLLKENRTALEQERAKQQFRMKEIEADPRLGEYLKLKESQEKLEQDIDDAKDDAALNVLTVELNKIKQARKAFNRVKDSDPELIGDEYDRLKEEIEELGIYIAEAEREIPQNARHIGLGARHMWALVEGVRQQAQEYAKHNNLDEAETVRNALAKKKVEVSINPSIAEDVFKDFKENEFFGLDRKNIVFVMNDDEPSGFEWRDSENRFAFSYMRNDKSYNHGYNLIYSASPYMSYGWDETENDFRLMAVPAFKYLLARGARSFVIHRVNDLSLLDPVYAAGAQLHAIYKFFRSTKKANSAFVVLQNFTGEKGGLLWSHAGIPEPFSALVEGDQLKTDAAQALRRRLKRMVKAEMKLSDDPYNKLQQVSNIEEVSDEMVNNPDRIPTLPLALQLLAGRSGQAGDVVAPNTASGNATTLSGMRAIAVMAKNDRLLDEKIIRSEAYYNPYKDYVQGKGDLIHDFKRAGHITPFRQMAEYQDAGFQVLPSARAEVRVEPVATRSEMRATNIADAVRDLDGLMVTFRNKIGSTVNVMEEINKLKGIDTEVDPKLTEPVVAEMRDSRLIVRTQGTLATTPKNLVSAAIAERILLNAGHQYAAHWGLTDSPLFQKNIADEAKQATSFLRRDIRHIIETLVKVAPDKDGKVAPVKSAKQINSEAFLHQAEHLKLAPVNVFTAADSSKIPSKAIEALKKGELAFMIYAAGEASRLRESFIRYGIVSSEDLRQFPEMARQFRMWNVDLWDVAMRLGSKRGALEKRLKESTDEYKKLGGEGYKDEKEQRQLDLDAARDAYAAETTPENLQKIYDIRSAMDNFVRQKKEAFRKENFQEFEEKGSAFVDYESRLAELAIDLQQIPILLEMIGTPLSERRQHLGLGIRHLIALSHAVKLAGEKYGLSQDEIKEAGKKLKVAITVNADIIYDVQEDLKRIFADTSFGLAPENVQLVLNDFGPVFEFKDGAWHVNGEYRTGYNHGFNIINANAPDMSYGYRASSPGEKASFERESKPALEVFAKANVTTLNIRRVNDLANIVSEEALDLPMINFYLEQHENPNVRANQLVEVLNNYTGQKGGLLYSDEQTPAPFAKLVEGLELETREAEETIELLSRKARMAQGMKPTGDPKKDRKNILLYNRLWQIVDLEFIRHEMADREALLGWMSVKDSVSVPGGKAVDASGKVLPLWSPEPATGAMTRMNGARTVAVMREQDALFEGVAPILVKDKEYETVGADSKTKKNGSFIHDFKEMKDIVPALRVLLHMDEEIAKGTIHIPPQVKAKISELIAGLETGEDPAKLAEIYFSRTDEASRNFVLKQIDQIMQDVEDKDLRFHARNVAGLIIGLSVQNDLDQWNKAQEVLSEFLKSERAMNDASRQLNELKKNGGPLDSAQESQRRQLEEQRVNNMNRMHVILSILNSALLEDKGSNLYQAAIWVRSGIDSGLRAQNLKRSEIREEQYPQVVDVFPADVQMSFLVNEKLNDKPYVMNASIDVPWEDLERPLLSRLDPKTQTMTLSSYHNLFHNAGFAAYDGNVRRLYVSSQEPIESRPYSMFVSWKTGTEEWKKHTASSEDLRFVRDPKVQGGVIVYRASDAAKTDLGADINFAVFGQRLIENNGQNVPLEQVMAQTSDIAQTYNGPQFFPKELNSNGTVAYGPAIGRAQLERDIVDVTRHDGYMKIDLTPYFSAAERAKDPRFASYIAENATRKDVIEAIEKRALQNWLWQYRRVEPMASTAMKPGEYFIQGDTLHVKMTPAKYPHNLIGITKSGKIVSIILTGKKYDPVNGKGYSFAEVQEIVAKKLAETGDPLDAVFVLANSRDAFKRVNGKFVEGQAGWKPYENSTAGIAFVTSSARSESRNVSLPAWDHVLNNIAMNEADLETAVQNPSVDYDLTVVITSPETVGEVRGLLEKQKGILFSPERMPLVLAAGKGEGSLGHIQSIETALRESFGKDLSTEDLLAKLKNKKINVVLTAGKGSRMQMWSAGHFWSNKGLAPTAGGRSHLEQVLGQRLIYDDPRSREGGVVIQAVDSAVGSEHPFRLPAGAKLGNFVVIGQEIPNVDDADALKLGVAIVAHPERPGVSEINTMIEKPTPEVLQFLRKNGELKGSAVLVSHGSYYLSWPAYFWLLAKVKELDARFPNHGPINWVEGLFEAATFGQAHQQEYLARYRQGADKPEWNFGNNPEYAQALLAMAKEARETFGVSFMNMGLNSLYLHANKPFDTLEIVKHLFENESYRRLLGIGIIGRDEWYQSKVSKEIWDKYPGRIIGPNVRIEEGAVLGPRAVITGDSVIQKGSVIDGYVRASVGQLSVPEHSAAVDILRPNGVYEVPEGYMAIQYIIKDKDGIPQEVVAEVPPAYDPWQIVNGKVKALDENVKFQGRTVADILGAVLPVVADGIAKKINDVIQTSRSVAGMANSVERIIAAEGVRSEVREELPTISLQQFMASNFQGPVIIGGTGMIGSHWIDTLARQGQRVAVALRSQGTETHIANLQRVYNTLKNEGLADRVVLVNMGDSMDPRQMDQSDVSYKALKQLMSKASVVYQLAAQTSTRPEAVTKGSTVKESPDEFIVRTYVVNVFYTKLIARISKELGIPMAYSSSQAIFALNPLFKEPMKEPVTEETPIPFDATTKAFMTELNKGFDAYVAQYVNGTASVKPEEFTRNLLTATKVARLDDPTIQENLFQIVGSGMQAYRDAKAKEYNKQAQPLLDKALADMAAKYPLVLAFGNYAISKLLPEKDVLGLDQGKGIVFRFVNVFGKGMHPNNVLQNNLDDLQKLIQGKISLSALHATNVLREFMSAFELAGPAGALSQVMARLISRSFAKNQIIHVGTGQVISMEEALLQTAEAVGADLRSVQDKIPRHIDQPSTKQPVMSYEKLKEALPQAQPKMTVSQGMKAEFPEISKGAEVPAIVPAVQKPVALPHSEFRTPVVNEKQTAIDEALKVAIEVPVVRTEVTEAPAVEAAKEVPALPPAEKEVLPTTPSAEVEAPALTQAAEEVQGLNLVQMFGNEKARGVEEAMQNAIMAKFEIVKVDGFNGRIVARAYNDSRQLDLTIIKQIMASKSTRAEVFIPVDTEGQRSEVQEALAAAGLVDQIHVVHGTLNRVVSDQMAALGIRNVKSESTQSVIQVRPNASLKPAELLRAYALVSSLDGIVSIVGFSKKIDWAKELNAASVITAAIEAVQAIGKSA